MPKDNKDELFWLVDADDNDLGSVKRGEANSNPDLIHRAVQIVLCNDKNETLMQKRSLDKDSYPGFWTVSASGHVDFGSTYDEAAVRELEEEIGLTNIALEPKAKYIIEYGFETEMETVYLGHTDKTPTKLDPFEVTEVKWVSIAVLENFIKNNDVTLAAIKAYQALGFIQ